MLGVEDGNKVCVVDFFLVVGISLEDTCVAHHNATSTRLKLESVADVGKVTSGTPTSGTDDSPAARERNYLDDVAGLSAATKHGPPADRHNTGEGQSETQQQKQDDAHWNCAERRKRRHNRPETKR